VKIFVKVKTRARQEKIEKIDDTNFKVWVKEAPEKGRANQSVLRVLAEYFSVSRSEIIIISGLTSRKKVVEINKIN